MSGTIIFRIEHFEAILKNAKVSPPVYPEKKER